MPTAPPPSRDVALETRFFWERFKKQITAALIIVLLAVMAFRAFGGAFGPQYYTPIELSGLYWHFVDLVWIFLFPLYYLIARHVAHGS